MGSPITLVPVSSTVDSPHQAGTWTFLTNHAHVLLAIAAAPDLRLRDIADQVGITERSAVSIITDLVEAGYVERRKTGRRNRYVLRDNEPLRHPLEAHHNVGRLLEAISHKGESEADVQV